jgi:hypothetical protein
MVVDGLRLVCTRGACSLNRPLATPASKRARRSPVQPLRVTAVAIDQQVRGCLKRSCLRAAERVHGHWSQEERADTSTLRPQDVGPQGVADEDSFFSSGTG